ncbi:DNA double-strand break repair nuclease NurA [Candidatus Woesearchaeota archaeon]|nr:DNA double-strand break repair nuclease NurA [Candidatus Woesearchaeota archaeon]
MDEIFKRISSVLTVDSNVDFSFCFGSANSGVDLNSLSINDFFSLKSVFTDKKFFFIDGGSSVLFCNPLFCVSFLRVAYVAYVGEKKVEVSSDEYFVSGVLDKINGRIVLTAENVALGVVREEFVYLDDSSKSVDFVGIINGFRRKLELELVCSLCFDNKHCCVVLDGDLDFGEHVDLYDSVVLNCVKNGVFVIGVAKGSDLRTGSGYPLLLAMDVVAKRFALKSFFVPLISKFYESVSLGVVSFNENSNLLFRLDYFSFQSDHLADLLCGLCFFSCDSALLGYPYGLIEVDDLARVSVEETNFLKIEFFEKFKDSDSLEFIDNLWEVHSFLDNMKF